MGSLVSLGARLSEVMVPCKYLELLGTEASVGEDNLLGQHQLQAEIRQVVDLMEKMYRERRYELPPEVAALHLVDRNEQLALTLLHHHLPEFVPFLLQGERAARIRSERSLRALARVALQPEEVREMEAIFRRAKERCQALTLSP